MIEFILYVADQEKSKNFYRAVLAKEPVLDVPGMTEFLLNDTCKLGLMPVSGIINILKDKTPDPASAAGVPRCEIYYYTSEPGPMTERLLQNGAQEINPFEERDWGDRAGYYSDPDGHIFVVAQRIELHQA